MPNVLEITGLAKRSRQEGNEASSSGLLFSEVTATIKEPERIALLGVSGQGKSTLLRILAKLDTADNGSIALYGTASDGADPRRWRMRMGYVAQLPVMLPGSVEFNLRTVSRLHGTEYDRKLAERLMGELGLENLALSKPATELSGGEKQRLSLARSLMLRPDVLLLDEITASLDRGSKERVERLLLRWHQEEGTAMIWVTHDLEQARQTCGRVWFMGEGTLLEDTPADAFFRAPATELASAYLRTPAGRELEHS
ncbi:ABC transporter ATP-binding protein [Cohnella nanjingensis]|uniref:ATP-binding cassette domain-containing protein n=1 Tax=Cohnella nanjingensis TaxID=1387779 RepID=A0A7X0RSL6_9BACL|nr:ATP-binding cassette domain-containing protein [Cohnella nanjingensis]MBB6672942.1 ATP-binding cassette domain-containing protein [Cohnella nanjingensis]